MRRRKQWRGAAKKLLKGCHFDAAGAAAAAYLGQRHAQHAAAVTGAGAAVVHLGRQDQRRRFNKLSSNPQTAWRVTPQDWERHRRYDDWTMAWEEVFDRTDTEWAPWTIIEANNRRFAWVKIYQTVMDVFAERLEISQFSQPEKISAEPSQASVVEAFQNADSDSLEPIIFTGSGSSKPDESIQTTVEKYPVELENSEKDI